MKFKNEREEPQILHHEPTPNIPSEIPFQLE